MINETLLHFVEYELQIIALAWLGGLYALKVWQLSRLPMPWEKAPARGSRLSGVLRSYGNIFLPWSMESSSKHIWRWTEFGLYHIAAFIAILNTFTMPFAPDMMTQPVRIAFAVLIAPAVPLGLIKLVRRMTSPELRLVSTPDDYFSLITLEFFFGSAVMVLLLWTPLWRLVYFVITAGFLFYVPFSKISHYVYFFFAGIITGSRYGWRGGRPQVRGIE